MTNAPHCQEQAPRRAFSRLRLGISARLETIDGRQKVRLIDLSQGGARVILSQPGAVREGVLTWLQFETFGTVAWQEGDQVGLTFDAMLALPVVVETRRQAPNVVRDEAMRVENAAKEWVAGRTHLGSER